ncbi:MAG TPA: fibronectin type III domain-containing protein, partial [Paludibacteraceae bacterium]|nr:fibronectin type III domain-containing protein [Paludibacteraceae bacterium]
AAMAVISATALGAGTYCDYAVTGGTMSYETTATNTYKVTYTSTSVLTSVANCNFYYRDNGGNGVQMSFSKVDVDGYVWAATFVTTYTAGDLTYANYCAFNKSGGGLVEVTFPTGTIANYAGTCSSVTVTIGEKTSTYNSVTLNWSVSGGTPTAQTVRYKESGTETWSNGPSVLANATSATITGLDASTTYDLKVIATVSSVDYEDTDTKATTNPTTCSGKSQVKNTLDGSLKNNCDFTVPYEFEITTSDLTENDPTVLVRYKYTQSQSIDNNQVKLCRMFEEGQIESELQMTAEAGGTGWWYINLEGETLGNLSVGDSAKFAIKVVPAGGCTGGTGTFYATRMFAYKVGVGCNDARAFEFTKRLASQTTFFIQTDASIQRILVNKKGSSEYIQDNYIEPAASKFALDISGYELGTYEFEIFDESGRSDDIKIIHTVY